MNIIMNMIEGFPHVSVLLYNLDDYTFDETFYIHVTIPWVKMNIITLI